MRKFYTLAAIGVAIAAATVPQIASATDPEAQRFAYENCKNGQWEEQGFATFNACTSYWIQVWEVNHP